MSKIELLQKLLEMFVAKYGFDTIVDIEPIYMASEQIGMFDTDTPRVKRIKVNKGNGRCKNFQLYIDFWGYGWTGDKNKRWYDERVNIIDRYGVEALASALGVKIKSETTYKIV